jgi:hypothetical protein
MRLSRTHFLEQPDKAVEQRSLITCRRGAPSLRPCDPESQIESVTILPKPIPCLSVGLHQCAVALVAENHPDPRPSEAKQIVYPAMLAGAPAMAAGDIVARAH